MSDVVIHSIFLLRGLFIVGIIDSHLDAGVVILGPAGRSK